MNQQVVRLGDSSGVAETHPNRFLTRHNSKAIGNLQLAGKVKTAIKQLEIAFDGITVVARATII